MTLGNLALPQGLLLANPPQPYRGGQNHLCRRPVYRFSRARWTPVLTPATVQMPAWSHR